MPEPGLSHSIKPDEGLQIIAETLDSQLIKHCGSWTGTASQPHSNADEMLGALDRSVEAGELTGTPNTEAIEVTGTWHGAAKPSISLTYDQELCRRLVDIAARCGDQESGQGHPPNDKDGPENVHISTSSFRRQHDLPNGNPKAYERLAKYHPLVRWYHQASQEEPPHLPSQVGVSNTQETAREK